MKQSQIDQLVLDIVTTLQNSGITAARIIDWSKGAGDDGIMTILRRHGFTAGQLADFAGKGALSKGDVWGIMREQRS